MRILEFLGVALELKKLQKMKFGYTRITPQSNYSPWESDKVFNKNYNKIKNFTLVDKYRCWELWELLEQVKELNGDILEVGAWRGGTGSLIAKRLKDLGIKNKVYLCDTFEGVVKAGGKDPNYIGGEHNETSKRSVERLIGDLDLDNAPILKGIFPDDTGKEIDNKIFRFCHIDVDVYKSAKDILDWVWERLEIRGIVVFDDYGFETCEGITELVNEYRNHKDRIIMHNLNGHAVMVKVL